MKAKSSGGQRSVFLPSERCKQLAPESEQVVFRNYMFCSSKIYSFAVKKKNNVENVNMQCKIRILSGTEKKIKDTPITYIACSSFPESMPSVTNSTDGKRGVFRSVTTSHGREDMRSKYET